MSAGRALLEKEERNWEREGGLETPGRIKSAKSDDREVASSDSVSLMGDAGGEKRRLEGESELFVGVVGDYRYISSKNNANKYNTSLEGCEGRESRACSTLRPWRHSQKRSKSASVAGWIVTRKAGDPTTKVTW